MKELNNGVMYAPRKALDIGCSIGISTEYLQDSFPKESEIYGMDLSPYFWELLNIDQTNKKEIYIIYTQMQKIQI